MNTKRSMCLAGCWDLISATFTALDGSVQEPWGPAPIGIAIFTETGDFSAHVMRAARRSFASEHPTPHEKQMTYDDYFSYFGRVIKFEQGLSTMVSRVDGATNPNWTGSEQIRYLDIEDKDHIVFRTPPLALAGTDVVGRLTWKRRCEGAALAP